MTPIYEQGTGRGIGHGLNSFLARFDQICIEHKKSRRAKAFAFIFYDFRDDGLRTILKDQGVFASLDRLSGDALSIFYLHTGMQSAVNKFNSTFLKRLEIEDQATPPCVVFFRLSRDQLTDVTVAQLDSGDLIHGFKELYDVVQKYIEGTNVKTRYIRWGKSAAKFVAIEGVKEAIKYGIGLR
jgi:hypothetical protein